VVEKLCFSSLIIHYSSFIIHHSLFIIHLNVLLRSLKIEQQVSYTHITNALSLRRRFGFCSISEYASTDTQYIFNARSP